MFYNKIDGLEIAIVRQVDEDGYTVDFLPHGGIMTDIKLPFEDSEGINPNYKCGMILSVHVIGDVVSGKLLLQYIKYKQFKGLYAQNVIALTENMLIAMKKQVENNG